MQTYLMSVLAVRSNDDNSAYVGVLCGYTENGVTTYGSFPMKREDTSLLKCKSEASLGTIVQFTGEVDTTRTKGNIVSLTPTKVIDVVTDQVYYRKSEVPSAPTKASLLQAVAALKQAITA